MSATQYPVCATPSTAGAYPCPSPSPPIPSSPGVPMIVVAFLVVFVGLFVLFWSGGIFLQRLIARHRARARATEEGERMADLLSQVPQLWHVWSGNPVAAVSKPFNDDSKGRNQSGGWTNLLPLSFALQAQRSDEIMELKRSTNRWTRRIWSRPASALSHDPDSSRTSAQPGLSTAEIAVLIAMPFSRSSMYTHSTWSTSPNITTISRDLPCELAIGTTPVFVSKCASIPPD